MKTISENIRRIASKLLEDQTVDAVFGFAKASGATMTRPFSARTPKDAETLCFDCNCRLNLTAYLSSSAGKVGIVVKACDSRNLVTLLIENRVSRDNLYIIGVPCPGMADRNRLIQAAGGDILALDDQGDRIVLSTWSGDTVAARSEVLQDNCRTCVRRNPVIFDELAGPPVEELELSNRFSDVGMVESLDTDDKQAFFEDLLRSCIRCYACRNVCPLCYCPVCFVDESCPQWVGKTNDPVDVKTYHLMRAFHDAGRCTDCGACEAACPMDIKMRFFTRKTIQDCVLRYGWEAGMSLDHRPALDRFRLDDSQEFIR